MPHERTNLILLFSGAESMGAKGGGTLAVCIIYVSGVCFIPGELLIPAKTTQNVILKHVQLLFWLHSIRPQAVCFKLDFIWTFCEVYYFSFVVYITYRKLIPSCFGFLCFEQDETHSPSPLPPAPNPFTILPSPSKMFIHKTLPRSYFDIIIIN